MSEMRLTEQQIEKISTIGQGIFGLKVRIYLFGSRVNNQKKGGDIDLFIETNDNQLATMENKIRFLVRLKMAIGDQKIDLVFPNNLISRPSFRDSIIKSRIRLC